MQAKMELKDLLEKYQVNQALLSRRARRVPKNFYMTMSRGGQVREKTLAPYVMQLSKLGEQLRDIKFKNNDLVILLKHFGLRFSWIAESLGISRQALWESYHRGFSEERKLEIQNVLQDAGKHILRATEDIRGKLGHAME